MMRQLMETIKKDNRLESVPFTALADNKVEIISGHHRIRAAKAAGLAFVYVLLDISGLSRSKIAAKQIAHNSINGYDDKDVLKEIAKLIDNVDDMIESYGGKDLFEEPTQEIEKLLSPKTDFDWKTMQFMFLPYQIEDLDRLAKEAHGNDYIGVANIEQYQKLLTTLERFKEFENVKNLGQAIYLMIEAANNKMENGMYDPTQEYVPLTRIIGSGAIPVDDATYIKECCKKMEEDGVIPQKCYWKGIVEACKKYLNE
jgi:hypothetical protein